MAYYLQMDGVDDYIKTPTITFNEIIFDFIAEYKTNTWQYFFDARTGLPNGWVQRTATNTQASGAGVTIYSDGVVTPIPVNQRCIARFTLGAGGTDDVNILSHNAVKEFMKAKMYDIKFYNGATLVAHYDMSTQTVLDQSGNGKHATLTGGTWLDDGVGGGTAHTKSLSDSVTTSESFSKQFSAMVVDSVATGDGTNEGSAKSFSDTVASADSIAYNQGKAVSLSDSIAISEAISKALTKWQTDGISTGASESEATSRRLSDAITQTDVITAFGGKSVILTEGIMVSDSVAKLVKRLRSDGLGLTESLGKQLSVRLYDVIISTDEVNTYLPNAPEYRHVMRFPVRLNTRQTVNVTITQRKQFDVDI